MPSRQLSTTPRGSDINQISRNEAVHRLCEKKLSTLSRECRESHILDWWGIDREDAEFSLLSSELQCQMLKNDEPPSDSENSKYNELIFIALQAKFTGVTNTFLSQSMVTTGLGEYDICGEIERLEVCPCCEYRTIESRGEYEICGLCDWEDNGVTDVDLHSGPNHMTLGEAKEKFAETKGSLLLEKWVKA